MKWSKLQLQPSTMPGHSTGCACCSPRACHGSIKDISALGCLQGTRDYNIGQGPEASVTGAAASMGISLPDVRARQFVPEKDIVVFDMVVVMDKYTAADVLKEVPP